MPQFAAPCLHNMQGFMEITQHKSVHKAKLLLDEEEEEEEEEEEKSGVEEDKEEEEEEEEEDHVKQDKEGG